MLNLVLAMTNLIDQCYDADPLHYVVTYKNDKVVINDGLLFSDAVLKFLECNHLTLCDYIQELKTLSNLEQQEARIMDDISPELWHNYVEVQMDRYQQDLERR